MKKDSSEDSCIICGQEIKQHAVGVIRIRGGGICADCAEMIAGLSSQDLIFEQVRQKLKKIWTSGER